MGRVIELCIVNRNYPPNPGATGYHAKRLMDHFEALGYFRTRVITTGHQKDTEGITYATKGMYTGKVKWRRLLSSFLESYRLIAAAKREIAHFYIIMTDPAFLNFWAALLLKKKAWALWTMDLYPEAFVANKLISTNSVFYKYYQIVLRKTPPSFIISLGPAQAAYLKVQYYKELTAVSMPVGLMSQESAPTMIRPQWADPSKIVFGYIGTIGEAHDAKGLIHLVRQLGKEKHVAIISCSGARAAFVTQELEGLKHVHIVSHLEHRYFAYIDIQIVTLMPTWTHVCVPSKAISGIQQGSAILFMGEIESDTWQYVAAAGWRLTKDYDSSAFLSNLDESSVKERKNNAQRISAKMEGMLELSYEAIEQNILDNLNKKK